MKEKNPFDRRSEDRRRADMVRNFEEEFRPKSHFDEWLSIYRTGQIFRTVLQLVSLFAALTLFCYPSKYFFGSWLYGIAPAVFILYFLEKLKRRSADVGFRRWLTEGRIPPFVLIVALLASAGSVLSSVAGTPIMVGELSPPPKLIDINKIKNDAEQKNKKVVDYWSEQIEGADSRAETIFVEGNYKGKISGRTKDQKYKHENEAAACRDSLNKYISESDASLQKEVEAAKKENLLATMENKSGTEIVAFWTAIGCFFLEIFFYLISFFLVRFRYISSIQLSSEPSKPDPTGGNRRRRRKESEELFRSVSYQSGNKGNILNETETETETENRKQETKQKQTIANFASDEASEKYRNETRNKTIILNKDIHHGTPTFKEGRKVLYYITNKNKKNESIKYYSEQEIEKFIKNYENRLQEARNKKNLKSIRTNREKLRAWKEYRERLSSYNPEVIKKSI